MFRIFDAHTHLHLPSFDTDREAILLRMEQNDVGAVTVGTNQNTSKQAIALAETSKRIFASVAYHPDHLTSTYVDASEDISYQPFNKEEIETIARSSNRVVAIGETGLDYYRMDEGIDIKKGKAYQQEIFEWHLDLAKNLNLPVIVHVRDAFDDLIEIISKRRIAGYKQGIVIHCFTGDWILAQKFIDLDCFLSFTGIITFKPRTKDNPEDHIHRVIERMPIDKLMIETDAPWLAPIPHRGERNEPNYVIHVAEKIAELRSMPLEDVLIRTTSNASTFFNLSSIAHSQ
jgi:TatD DNase family protein